MGVEMPGGPASPGGWPVHEVGRNADVFNPDSGKLLRAGSRVGFGNVHMHANGKDTTGHLEIAFKFHPKDYKPKFVERLMPIATGDIDIRPMEAGQKVEAFMTLTQPTKVTVFEPHMHAAAVRMCFDAIFGSRMETLSCSGYDHSWVRAYQYEDDSAPLLPRGTILRVTGYYDNTPANRNVVDPRNWSGLGHRSIDNMNIMIMQGVSLTDEQFQAEVKARREHLKLKPGEDAPGCPLCAFDTIPAQRAARRGQDSSSHASRRRGSRVLGCGASAHPSVAGIGLVTVRRAGAADRRQHHTGLRRLAAESGRLVRTAVRLHESGMERRDVHSAWPGQQHGAGRPGSRASRRTSSRGAVASRSRSTCRRTSAPRKSSGR